MQFQILGPVSAHINGQSVHIGAPKVRSMLSILLLSPNKPVTVSTLENRLWDEPAEITAGQRPVKGRDLPPEPHKTVQIYATRLRAALKKANSPATISTESRAYRLNVDPTTIDYHRFRTLASNGRRAAQQGDLEQACDAFSAAIELWHGPPLADLTTAWAHAQRDTLITRDLLPAYYGLFDAYLELRRYESVLDQLHPLLREYDTDETFAGQWMRAVAAVDGPDKLPTFFRAFCERVDRLLDSGPSDHLVRLYDRLTQHQPAISLPASPVDTGFRPAPRQLPRPTPYFTGRQDILAVLDDLLGDVDAAPPIVVIDGPPGIGKSALVAHWANRHSFPDGELFVNLGGHSMTEPISPAAALAAFLGSLEVPPDRVPQDIRDRDMLLRQLLAGRRTLVVLDGARDSDHVRPILAAVASCAVIVTSRQQLTGLVHRDGAHRITLPRLAPDDAVTLLRRRIGDARAERAADAIHDLACLCDGLPLGLRITAEHVAARPDVPIDDLVAQLQRQRRILLDTGSHGDDDTVTLRAVFSCSYAALIPEASRLFRFLGLHPGADFSARSVAALVGSPVQRTEQVLDVLLGANLVEQRTVDRFKLHDLLQLFAVELVSAEDAGTRNEAIHRILDWYLGTIVNAARRVDPHRVEVPQLPLTSGVDPQRFRDEEEALGWCLAERVNVLAAVRFAADQGFHEHAWRLVGEFDDLMHRYGDPRELLEIHQVALQSARTANAKEGEAGLLNNLGFTYFFVKDYDRAARHLREARIVYREIGDTYGEAVCLTNIATTCMKVGDFHAVIGLYERAIALFDQAGNETGKAAAYHRLGDAYRRVARHDAASDCYEMALRIRQELDHRGQADTLTALGELRLAQGDVAAAIGHCEKALILHRRALDERRTAEALEALATAYCRADRHADAVPLATEAAHRYGVINEPHGQARSLRTLGEAHQAIGENSAARADWTAAIALFRELDDPDAAEIEKLLASPAGRLGGPDPAASC